MSAHLNDAALQDDGRRKVLIVDDSPTSRQIIRNHLSRHRRTWSLFESDNGEDALAMVGMIQPDFVTLDVNMPNMSGLAVAEEMVKMVPKLHITLITANIQDAVRKRAAELGIGFLEKPVKETTVLRAITILEESRERTLKQLRAGAGAGLAAAAGAFERLPTSAPNV